MDIRKRDLFGLAAGIAAGTTLAQAWDLAEQFRQELATEGLLLAGQRLELTTSQGVGCFTNLSALSRAWRVMSSSCSPPFRSGRFWPCGPITKSWYPPS